MPLIIVCLVASTVLPLSLFSLLSRSLVQRVLIKRPATRRFHQRMSQKRRRKQKQARDQFNRPTICWRRRSQTMLPARSMVRSRCRPCWRCPSYWCSLPATRVTPSSSSLASSYPMTSSQLQPRRTQPMAASQAKLGNTSRYTSRHPM